MSLTGGVRVATLKMQVSCTFNRTNWFSAGEMARLGLLLPSSAHCRYTTERTRSWFSTPLCKCWVPPPSTSELLHSVKLLSRLLQTQPYLAIGISSNSILVDDRLTTHQGNHYLIIKILFFCLVFRLNCNSTHRASATWATGFLWYTAVVRCQDESGVEFNPHLPFACSQ